MVHLGLWLILLSLDVDLLSQVIGVGITYWIGLETCRILSKSLSKTKGTMVRCS